MSTLHGLVGEGKLNLRKGLDKYRGGGARGEAQRV